MLENFSLIRNVGKFDSIDAGANLNLNRLALIYAENGRGKTTLATILRSLGDKEPLPIIERTRLGGQGEPHIVIANNNGNTALFQNGAWGESDVNILVFDDSFVTDNIYSGIDVDTEHRQKLHELIIGAEGIALNAALQQIVTRIEEHNRAIKEKGARITAAMRFGLSIEAFCALEDIEGVDDLLQEAERALAAARKSEIIAQKNSFISLSLPDFDLEVLNTLLATSLPDIETASAAQVNEHIASLGDGGESWVAAGMKVVTDKKLNDCPFCKQGLSDSDIIPHYQSIFSQEYSALKDEISTSLSGLERDHRAELMTAFERNVRTITETRQFWSEFIDIPEIDLDTASVTRLWRSCFDAIKAALDSKRESPLEVFTLNQETFDLVDEYRTARNTVHELSDSLTAVNEQIEIIKERAAESNIAALEADLNGLKAVKSRYRDAVSVLCNDYLAEVALKTETEKERVLARAALDQYREQVFPQYEEAINRYLVRFNAGYRLGNVSSVNNRGGSSCSYNVLIENVSVPLRSNQTGQPSFKTTLSSGDRNALALAFFFTSIEMNANRASLVVVIDDPMTSLDDHRSLTTRQEIAALLNAVDQVVVLSHSKSFLCGLWNNIDKTLVSAIKIARLGTGSTLSEWDVNQDSITEYDRNYLMVSNFIEQGHGADERSVAVALRPILESYIRITCPNIFPSGSLLGPFLGICQQREGLPEQILSPEKRTELRALLDYANDFHHDTNPAWQTENINDQELLDHATRIIQFVSI